ncbi:hypothetical protein ACOME3_007052 [Neoechinorhynchus agilis]
MDTNESTGAGQQRRTHKPKGRMSAYTFFLQTCREEFRKSNPEQPLRFTDFSKECSSKWRQLSEQDKTKFFDMANRDKIRYEREMDSYAPPPPSTTTATNLNINDNETKRKRKKDPNAPKRPLSAFFIFCSDQRTKVKEKHPEFSVADISKHLGTVWATMTDEDKKQYYQRNQTEKERYQAQMLEYNANITATKRSRPPAAASAAMVVVDQVTGSDLIMMQQQQQAMMFNPDGGHNVIQQPNEPSSDYRRRAM